MVYCGKVASRKYCMVLVWVKSRIQQREWMEGTWGKMWLSEPWHNPCPRDKCMRCLNLRNLLYKKWPPLAHAELSFLLYEWNVEDAPISEWNPCFENSFHTLKHKNVSCLSWYHYRMWNSNPITRRWVHGMRQRKGVIKRIYDIIPSNEC